MTDAELAKIKERRKISQLATWSTPEWEPDPDTGFTLRGTLSLLIQLLIILVAVYFLRTPDAIPSFFTGK